MRARLRPFAQPEFQMSLPLLREQLLIPTRNVVPHHSLAEVLYCQAGRYARVAGCVPCES